MKILTRIAEAFLPNKCYECGRRLLGQEQCLCTECMLQLPLLNLDDNAGDNDLSRQFWPVCPIVGAAAAYKYLPGGKLGRMLHFMKYRRKAGLCHYAGRLMAVDAVSRQILSEADVLLPVPLTRERQEERGYNQSEEICKGIVEVVPLPIVTDVLRRVHFVDSQTAMTPEERRQNIRGAFAADDTRQLEGKHVVIVDDVITTGATVSECILQLRDVPGIRISVMSFVWTRSF